MTEAPDRKALGERGLVSDAAEAAYHRTDLLDQRREMIEAWERHVASQS